MLVCSQCYEFLEVKDLSVDDNGAYELYVCPNCDEKAYIQVDFRSNTKTIMGGILNG